MSITYQQRDLVKQEFEQRARDACALEYPGIRMDAIMYLAFQVEDLVDEVIRLRNRELQYENRNS